MSGNGNRPEGWAILTVPATRWRSAWRVIVYGWQHRHCPGLEKTEAPDGSATGYICRRHRSGARC